MKRKCAELKRIARDNLTFQYGIPMLAMVASYAISVVLSSPFTSAFQSNPNSSQKGIYFLATFIITLIQTILGFGLCKIHLGLARQEKIHTIDLFYFFRNHPDRYIIYGLLMFAITFFCMVPFVILSIFYILSSGSIPFTVLYIAASLFCVLLFIFVLMTVSLTQYLLIDHTDWTVRKAFRESGKLMRGNKGRLFHLYVSFLGWSILGLITFNIGFLWIVPYFSQTICIFYLDATNELDAIEQKKMLKYRQAPTSANFNC